jgi:hypothetical protein
VCKNVYSGDYTDDYVHDDKHRVREQKEEAE